MPCFGSLCRWTNLLEVVQRLVRYLKRLIYTTMGNSKLRIGDLVSLTHKSEYGLVIDIVEIYARELPSCHILVAFLSGVTYWRLCEDVEVISYVET
jgi:chromate transport protein ChrA